MRSCPIVEFLSTKKAKTIDLLKLGKLFHPADRADKAVTSDKPLYHNEQGKRNDMRLINDDDK